MIDINKKYRTESGCDVRIYAVDGGGIYPIHGAYESRNHGWATVSWTEEGEFISGEIHPNNLVEVKPKVAYLKPLHVILSECVDYKFESTRLVVIHELGVTSKYIFYKDLPLFGKETLTPIRYPGWFIEWREDND